MNHVDKPLYCPSCGAEITERFLIPGVGRMLRSFVQVTCRNPGCKLCGATASDVTLKSGEFLRQWKVDRKFDLYTGEQLK